MSTEKTNQSWGGRFSEPVDAFVANSLPAPVSFEPYRAIRDLAFQFRSGGLKPRAVTYQPGDWNKVEIVEGVESGLSLEATERALLV